MKRRRDRIAPHSRLVTAMAAAIVSIGLFASACGEPSVPIAASELPNAFITATPTPAPPTPTPTVTPTPTPTPQLGATPTPTPLPVKQPGLDSTSIRIAVIADVETGGTADDLFRDTWSGIGAWALDVNGRNGIGGRDVIVVPVDTALFDHRARLEAVCTGEFFAIVGGQSLGDYDGAELLGTEDCDVGDFPSAIHGARRAISPNTFIANPILEGRRQAGPARWLANEYPDAAENVALFYFDELELRNETERLREMLVGEGLTTVSIDTDLEEGPSEAIIDRLDEAETRAIVWNADPARLIDLLRELDTNDLSPTWVLCELGCYSEAFLRQGGAAVEGVHAWIPHVPFDSPIAPKELLDYRFYLSEFSEDVGWSEVGLEAWMAGRLFEEAMLRMLSLEESPERQQVVTAAESITQFDANGVLPPTNPGERQPTACFALMVVREGRWVQAHPQPPLALDCDATNLYELVATRSLGVEPEVSTSSTTSDSEPVDDEIDLEGDEVDLELDEDDGS